ncbi:uncharacterized protein [Nothobranchius furzeri]|uniref:uncharacterized protein n=1 Tax=Nothobranchius furzeri TaxID=105023 RepID=UPI002404355B|nr:uncharacterized protein LOC129163761 [Nothobranchius furzeri]
MPDYYSLVSSSPAIHPALSLPLDLVFCLTPALLSACHFDLSLPLNLPQPCPPVDVPGQRRANITKCAAIANAGLLLHRCQVGPYNTECLLVFLNDLHLHLVPEQNQEGEIMRTFVITWDNVAFHHSQAITAWFEAHPRLVRLLLPPYSPFLNPIEEFFSAWRWKFTTISHTSLLEAMDAGCRDITVDDCQEWIRHSRQFYPMCMALDDVRCNVDENMWPNPEDHRD